MYRLKKKKIECFDIEIYVSEENKVTVFVSYFSNKNTIPDTIQFETNCLFYKRDILINLRRYVDYLTEYEEEENIDYLFDTVSYIGKTIHTYYSHHLVEPKYGNNIKTHEDIIGLITHYILTNKKEYLHSEIFDFTRKEIDKSTIRVTAKDLNEKIDYVLTVLLDANMIISTKDRKYKTKTIKRG